MTTKLSICFCAYNEQDNIASCLDDAMKSLPVVLKDDPSWEILVIDNASTDRTPEVVKEYASKDSRIRLVRHDSNRFYSGSHKTAFQEANGDYIAIIDGDHQHTAQDIAKYMDLINQEGVDVAYGWKRERHDGLMRSIFSVGLRMVSRYLIGHKLHDINCGYRVLKKDAAKQIVIQETINSVGPELYMECRRLHLKVGEVVVTHFARTKGQGMHSTITPMLRSTWKFVRYLLRLREKYESRPYLPVSVK